ncbi:MULTISPECIES: asparagine synthase-related protein [Pseudofrankia]|uniref:asparagine synthase-related protein n=1 Tax=Pseudofrankia TaxID=2994363 RepID=UPI000234B820|nr:MULTISPECIES: asparagine synthase-related protein [Pseudofrankia]OHV36070.1 asparagine synthase [Pseudofrankia sp. EUN1h]
MTFCGELRLDRRPATIATAERMLAAAITPPSGPTRTWAAGPLALAATPGPALGPDADLAHTAGPGGLLAVVDGWSPGTRSTRPEQGDIAGSGRDHVAGHVVSSWRRYGPSCLDRLLGDWALAVFDAATGRLTLARSPRSMRRLFLHSTAERVVFGTDYAQLRAAGIPLEADHAVLAETLTRDLTTLNETLLRGVERVPAGHLVEIGPAGTRTRRPFSSLFSIVPPLRPSTTAAAASRLRAALDAAVGDAALQTAAPGSPVAVGVSGGLDSSSVAGVAHALARRGAAIRIVPISMVFPGQPHDESRWIDSVEERLRLPILRVKPDLYDWDRWRAWTATTLDLPPRPNLALSDAVRDAARAEGLSVLLSGEGGDEWWTGYRHHFPDLLRAGRLATLWRQTGRGINPRSLPRRLGVARAFATAPYPRGNSGERLVLPWLRPERLRGLDLEERFAAADAAERAAYPSNEQRHRWIEAAIRAELSTLDTLRAFYTSAGLDWRHPFHDRRTIEAALSTPGATLYQPGLTKPVLRAAAGDTLPELVRTRPGKIFFNLPVVDALEVAGGIGKVLAGGPLVSGGWVDLDAATRAWEAAAAAARQGRHPPNPLHGLASLWQLVGVDTWLTGNGVRL